jgi:UPF0271 protein
VVESVTGAAIRLDADTICVHGDGPNSVEIARTVRSVLEEEGVRIEAWQASAASPPERASA